MRLRVTGLTLLVFALSLSAQGQGDQPPKVQTGSIVGTVTGVNGDTLIGANVVLEGPSPSDRQASISDENGFFAFHDIRPGIAYRVTVSAPGFEAWTLPAVSIGPNESRIVTDIQLRVSVVHTTVEVTQNSEEAATEEVKIAEKQRIFGVIPNFYVVYDSNPAPLTPKLKFKLALRVSIDPVTFAGIAILSGAQQAGDTPNYGQGALGFAKRFGANTADGFTDIMIGGAMLPSLLHQDPRYFFQGTGSGTSRTRHAVLSPFVCKGDNGKWHTNFSSLGGDLASSAISTAYYPDSNRGAGLVFTNFALNTAEGVAAALAQEFVLHKLTRKAADSN